MFCIYWKSFLEGLFAKLCGSRVGIGGCVGGPRRVVCRGDNCPGNWGCSGELFFPQEGNRGTVSRNGFVGFGVLRWWLVGGLPSQLYLVPDHPNHCEPSGVA